MVVHGNFQLLLLLVQKIQSGHGLLLCCVQQQPTSINLWCVTWTLSTLQSCWRDKVQHWGPASFFSCSIHYSLLNCAPQYPTMFTSAGTIAPASITNTLADVYIVSSQDSAVGAAAAAIQQFVSNGGGLVTGAQVWSWSGSAALHHVNLVLSPMGILTTKSWVKENYTFPLVP